MLECKYTYLNDVAIYGSELIDTCWNVNHFASENTLILEVELIDTCWNVNSVLMDSWEFGAVELIDTCWNVNQPIPLTKRIRDYRINRYMLECKYK